MKKLIPLLLCLPLILANGSCDADVATTDNNVTAQQAKALEEAQAQVGMPAIVNFQEKRMLKTIYELRDNAIATHTYLINQMTGCLIYIGPSVGYGMPYAAQYSNPQRPAEAWETHEQGNITLPQAEPNGLFMPSDAHGTWVLLKDPAGTDVKPVYVEPDVLVVPFRLKDKECK